jgi:hypothetical protein
MEKTLDDVIIEVLNASKTPLKSGQIEDLIRRQKLWRRPKDGMFPSSSQISARTNNSSEYFTKVGGYIYLKESLLEDRLCKIVWNSNNWIKPMERSWNPRFIDDVNKGFEQKHGFVGEDWLFNPKFIFDGYQYGYIRGISKLNSSIDKIDTIFLFTINPNSKERFYVGKLKDAEVLQPDEISINIKRTIKSYEKEMLQELKDNGADFSEFKKYPFTPNVRFKIESKDLFQMPITIESSWFSKKFFRTTPIKMTDELYELFTELEKEIKFKFIPSSPDNKVSGYKKYTKEASSQVENIHVSIEKALYAYLLNKGISKSNIACDTTSFGGKLADVVVKTATNTFDIFEIKTDTDIRRGLREAVGQLLDYATWEKNITINKITAVLLYLPLSDNIKRFIQRLAGNLNIQFEVLFYDKASNSFSLL